MYSNMHTAKQVVLQSTQEVTEDSQVALQQIVAEVDQAFKCIMANA